MSVATTRPPLLRGAIAAAASAVLLALAACGSSDAGEEKQVTDLKVGAAPSLSGLGLRVAIAEENFSKRGLNVTPVANKSANAAIPQLLSGDLQIAMVDTLTLLQARNQGLPVRIIAGAGEQSTDGEAGQMSAASVVAKASSPIKSPLDLVGKKVGVPAIKTQTWMNIRAVVDAAGGDSSKIQFVEVPPAQMIDLVQRGDIDAATPNEPLASSSISSGAVKLVQNTDAPGNKGVPSSVYVATEQFIAKNPDTVKKFAEAVQDAAKQVNGNRDLAAKIAEQQLNFKPEQLKTAFYQTFAADPVTQEGIDKIADLAVKYEILTTKPDAKSVLADLS
ncbi:hypothetical protein GCM10011608_46110 [Micromonospora sonchi]|uniref:SsuA/THI5-like domain-containing protein n=1 Tax=Micromonospora sonchi TaxID=1763543 RepID=A0A917U4C2_9ACTN|nr:ABC transporter substrate-binding protein [Micromonospora sonchi]GGM56032.1 hypothetical protein GCM10011608_46110 [Micromonospora sonchi]